MKSLFNSWCYGREGTNRNTDRIKPIWRRNSRVEEEQNRGSRGSRESNEKEAEEEGALAGEEEEEEEEEEYRQIFATIVVNLDIGEDFVQKINAFAVEGEDICRMSVRTTI
jgi:hypothetical protein